MRKVYINGRFLTQKITGVQRYAHEIIRALDYLISSKEIADIDFEIIMPRHSEIPVSYKSINIRQIGVLQGHLWEQLELPIFTRGELLINLCNVAPIIKYQQFVVIHDAAVFANSVNFSFLFRTWYHMLLKILIKNSQQIITVSNFSKNELEKYCSKALNDIRVIYEGAEHICQKGQEDTSILKQFNLLDKPYILAVGSFSPNKNLKAIISALEHLQNYDVNLVAVGAVNNKIFRQFLDNNVPSYVKCIGYVTDEQLKALYMNAACFVYPSFYEGFGLPPLEAMACGCPVIVSNTASLPEVCSDAAIYCDPFNPQDIAEKLSLFLNTDVVQEELRIKGLKHSKQFTWEQSAKEITTILTK